MQVPVDQFTSSIESPPEEAVKNIDNARLFDMNPSDYKQSKAELDKEVVKLQRPQKMEESVARYIAQSPEHVAAITPEDAGIFDYASRYIKFTADQLFDRPTNDRKIIDLRLREMKNPKSLTEDDQIELLRLNEERDVLAKRDYGIDGFTEQLPALALGQVGEMVRGVKKNADLIAFGTGAGLAVGAGAGALAGGVGAIPGAIGGAVTGFGVGVSTAFMKDAYDRVTGSMFNELSVMRDEKTGEPLNIDHDTKKGISVGIGIVSAGLEAAVGRAIAKGTPFLNKFTRPGEMAKFVLNPRNAAFRTLLVNMGRTAGTEATVESVQEVAQIFGEEMGQSYDGTEASFLNALQTTAMKMPGNAGRIAKAGAVGGVAGGGITAVTGGVGFKRTKGEFRAIGDLRFTEPGIPRAAVTQATKALELNATLEDVLKAFKSTKLMQMSPNEVVNLADGVFKDAGVKKLWLDIEDARKFSSDEKKGAALRDLIDPSGETAARMNAPIPIGPEKMLKLAIEMPDILDHVRATPNAPSPVQAEEFLKNLKGAENDRRAMLDKLGAKDISAEEKKTLQQALDPAKAVGDVADPDWTGDRLLMNEQDYMDQPTFTRAIRNVLPEAEVEKFDAAQIAARKSVADAINEAAEYEMNQVQDLMELYNQEVQFQLEQDRIRNDPNYAIIDTFKRDVVADSKGNKKVSLYAMDPKLLSKEQLKYVDNARLKEHGAFTKEGLSPDEAAKRIGVASGDELLKILSGTPTRKEITQARMRAQEVFNRQIARDSVDLNEIAITKAYNNNTLNHLKEMRFLLDHEWSSTKKGIKRIALPMPRIEDLSHKAYSAVIKTKVGDLNVQQFRVGERKSQRMAVNAILKNQVELAFMNKESAALNSEFIKHTQVAIGKVNRARKYALRFDTPEFRRTIKEAGSTTENAVNELLTMFDLNPSRSNSTELPTGIDGSFAKWVAKMQKEGRGDFSIDPRLTEVPAQSSDDMTVEQLLIVTERLKALYHQAKESNKLYKEMEKAVNSDTREAVIAKIDAISKAHQNYTPDRILPPSSEVWTTSQGIRRKLGLVESSVANAEHILKEWDGEKLGGYMVERLWHPIKGDGAFKDKSGFSLRQQYLKAHKKVVEANIKKYGAKDYDKLNAKVIQIEEFKGTPYHKVTKAHLMVLWAYGGDPHAVETRAKNSKLSPETIQQVLDRELEERDIVFMQNMVDVYKTYRDDVAKLQKKTTGQDATFIEGIPNRWRDKVLPGGYVPNKYMIDLTKKQVDKEIEALKSKPATYFEKQEWHYSADMTDQGYLIEREGSEKPLDLSLKRFMRGHEEVIHDLSYREALIDYLSILNDDGVKQNGISVLGHAKYETLLSTGVELATRMEAENVNYFSDQTRMVKDIAGFLQSNFSVSVLSLNPTSTIIQMTSLAQVTQNMGVTGPKYILQVMEQMAANPHLFNEFYEFAAQHLDPTIGSFVDGIQNKISSNVIDLLPKNTKSGLGLAKAFHKWTVEIGMKPMGMMDVLIKTWSAHASYQQFLSGDAPGFPLDVINKMSSDEKLQKAQAYASQVSRTSLTHAMPEDKAPFQKNILGSLVTNYWNDARNNINNQMAQSRRIKWQGQKTKDAVQEGDWRGALKHTKRGAGIAAGVVITAILTRAAIDALRGRETPFDREYDLTSREGIVEANQYLFSYLLSSPIETAVGSSPLFRDVDYAAFQSRRRSPIKTVEFPLNKPFTDLATSAAALNEFMWIHREIRGFSPVQVRAMLSSISVFALPIPVNAFYKGVKYMQEWENEDFSIVTEPPKSELQELNDGIKEYKDAVKPKGAMLEDLDKLQEQIAPKVVEIPKNAPEIIAQAVSGGDWTKKDPDSSAAGLYQFTVEQWKDVQARASEWGFTDNGRVAKDDYQQKMATEWLLEDNARRLMDSDIPANMETLYGSHVLGVEDYIKVATTPRNTKLKSVIDQSRFSQFKTVGQLRDHLNQQLVEAEKQLTSTASNIED